jgi:hypothetical protein
VPRDMAAAHPPSLCCCSHAQEREQYTIATKCGIVIEGGGMRWDGSRAHVRAVSGRKGVPCSVAVGRQGDSQPGGVGDTECGF